MIVSITQPAYLPWAGYLHRIAVSDMHIVLDTVQFEKNSFTNRNRVRTASGAAWLTVPLRTKGRFGDLAISDVEIADDGRWATKHWRTLEANYRRAPHFAEHRDFFEATLTRPWRRLVDLTDHVTAYLLDAFGISTPLVKSSELGVSGAKDELVMNLCAAVGATDYLSGPFGRDYLRDEVVRRAAVRVHFHDYRPPTYPQAYPDFVPNLSAVDLLFNCGPESRAVLCRDQEVIPA